MATQVKLSSGALVIRDRKVLLVHFRESNGTGFWIPPGGGAENREDILSCAVRETFEETGVRVRAERIVYVQEFIEKGTHVCKHWVLCGADNEDVSYDHRVGEERELLTEARFCSESELRGLNVVPEIMKDQFWRDLDSGFPVTRHLGFQIFSE